MISDSSGAKFTTNSQFGGRAIHVKMRMHNNYDIYDFTSPPTNNNYNLHLDADVRSATRNKQKNDTFYNGNNIMGYLLVSKTNI